MAFKWNMASKYWRSTQELYNQASQGCGSVEFIPEGFVRWDENFGRIGLYGDDAFEGDPPGCDEYENGTIVQPRAYVRRLNRNLRDQGALQNDTFWNRISDGNTACTGCNNAAKGINMYYRDPEPIPKIYLQLQPQLSAINAGVGQAIAQIQFEIHIDVELMGQCPSILEASGLTGGGEAERAMYARRWFNNFGWKIPLYYPIVESDDFTAEN